MMKKKLTFLSACVIALIFTVSNTNAQSYNTGIGLRAGGFEQGLTIKHFTDSKTALEGIVGFGRSVFVVTGLYEKHATAFSEPSLKWYYGVGAHIGSISEGRYYKRYYEENNFRNGLILGADAILGLEWMIPEIPFTLGVDLQPRLELAKGPFIDVEPGLSIRYVF